MAAADEDNYVSRAGHKLAGALDAFPAVEVKGKRCLDAGASTGGFTEVLLRRGAILMQLRLQEAEKDPGAYYARRDGRMRRDLRK